MYSVLIWVDREKIKSEGGLYVRNVSAPINVHECGWRQRSQLYEGEYNENQLRRNVARKGRKFNEQQCH
jgi:hypothetical protein